MCGAEEKGNTMPVRIERLEEMSEEEFDRLRRARSGRAGDPGMEELLDRLEAGERVRVPVAAEQSARGLRVAVGRRASQRGMRVEAVEGEGFVGFRRADAPTPRQDKRQPAAEGPRKRGRPKRHSEAQASNDYAEPRDADGLSETME